MCDKPLAQGQAQCKHLTTVVAFLERRADKWLRKAKESITVTIEFPSIRTALYSL